MIEESRSDRPHEPLLTAEGLGALVTVPLATVYKWRTTGRGPRAIKVGRHLRYRVSDVNAWLEACADEPA